MCAAVGYQRWSASRIRDCGSVQELQRTASASVPVAFRSGGLRIGALLTKPIGNGPFPVYIHNHGAMTRMVASEPLWKEPEQIDTQLSAAGYVVLRPARRGNLGSGGTSVTYWANDSSLHAADVIKGAYDEAADVEAALDFVKACPFVDPARVALGGHSVGGIVTVVAAGRRPDAAAVVTINAGITWTLDACRKGTRMIFGCASTRGRKPSLAELFAVKSAGSPRWRD